MRNTPPHAPSKSKSASTSPLARHRSAMALTLVGALVGATVACSLNPQPLPPEDDDRIAANPTGEPSAGGTFGDASESSPRDAAAPPAPLDGSPRLDAGADAPPADAATDASPADAATDATRD